MTQFLPPNLLALFAPRDAIPYLPPANKLPHEKKNGGYVGVGSFLKFFEVSFRAIHDSRFFLLPLAQYNTLCPFTSGNL